MLISLLTRSNCIKTASESPPPPLIMAEVNVKWRRPTTKAIQNKAAEKPTFMHR